MTAEPPRTDPLLGRVLEGRYRIDAVVASGGMATVFRGLDLRLQRIVAVKVMHAHLAADVQFRERFMREALVAARLSHPNVVSIFDQGHDADVWYLVMEYLPGITLRQLLRRRGALSPRQSLSLFEPVLAGLAAAHAEGILHRDIKPENILLCDDGRVKLADFGLARPGTAQTSTGSLLGSVGYMAPELLTHHVSDARSDIYSLGIVLYEMLVGTPPFSGDDALQVALAHATTEVPPPSERMQTIPLEVDELVLWATASDPDDRPRSAELLLEQAEDVATHLDDDTGHPYGRGTLPLPFPSRADTAPTTLLDGATVALATPTLEPATSTSLASRSDLDTPAVHTLQRRASRARRRGTVLALLVILLAALAGTAGWYFGAGPGSLTIVPNAEGVSAESARNALEAAGFLVQTSEESSVDVPSGSVISTDPAGGSPARPGSTVTITVSTEPAIVAVPDVVGSTQDVAEAALVSAGFAISPDADHVFSSTVASGAVFSLSAAGTDLPRGSTLAQGTTITLTVSLGAVPDVTGEDVDAATSMLSAVGLSLTVSSREFDDSIPEGAIISQKAAVEGAVRPGDTVDVVVSKGQDLVAVPDGLVQGSVASAVAALQSAGFTVEIDNDWLPEVMYSLATVSSLDPDEGTTIKRGSTVTIHWSFNG